MKLNVPRAVISKLKSNLSIIEKFSKDDQKSEYVNKPMKELECSPNISVIKPSSDDYVTKEPDLKLIKLEPKLENNPGPSSMPDFIQIDREEPVSDSGDRILSLRGAGDYKYGYNDIITGTFQEKLEESLAKGIKIAKTVEDTSSLNLALYEDYINKLTKPHYKRMLKFRETLPTYKKRVDLLHLINNNQVVVISGETGCGKSTQVLKKIKYDNFT